LEKNAIEERKKTENLQKKLPRQQVLGNFHRKRTPSKKEKKLKG